MINPNLVKLLDSIETMDIIRDSVEYQLQKIQNMQKSVEGKEWYEELPNIIKEKFDNYKVDYEKLSLILKTGIIDMTYELKKGYYYWRLIHSACSTYSNDLVEYDKQLSQEFNLKETDAISENEALNNCLGILEQHVVED